MGQGLGSAPEALAALREATGPSKTALKIASDIGEEVLGPAARFCNLPQRYAHCLLEHVFLSEAKFEEMAQTDPEALMQSRAIINPRECQLSALTFFRLLITGNPLVCQDKNPFLPKAGVYLIGKPGCAKTHILAAAARLLHQRLWAQLENYLGEIAAEIGKELRKVGPALGDADVKDLVFLDPKAKGTPELQRIQKLIATWKDRLANAEYKPTDVLWIGFDDLYDLILQKPESRTELLQQIVDARLLFLDDPHPKGVDERFQLIQEVIERRYNCGKRGTFIASNLEPTAMSDKQGVQNAGDLAARLRSRCRESFWEIKFEDCVDWRDLVRSREWRKISEAISADSRTAVPTQRKAAGLPEKPAEGKL